MGDKVICVGELRHVPYESDNAKEVVRTGRGVLSSGSSNGFATAFGATVAMLGDNERGGRDGRRRRRGGFDLRARSAGEKGHT